VTKRHPAPTAPNLPRCVAVCRRVLQGVAGCCSVLQCVAVRCSALQCVTFATVGACTLISKG